MKMIPIKVVNKILKYKDINIILDAMILLGSAGVAHIIEYKTGMRSLWWYYLTIGVGTAINILFGKIYNHRVRKQLDDLVQKENNEIATMLIERKIINPSQIKPILKSITDVDDEEEE